MKVSELIAILSEQDFELPVLIKSFVNETGSLTLFEPIVEVKKEGIIKGEGVKVPIQIYNAIVITPSFDNRDDPLKNKLKFPHIL